MKVSFTCSYSLCLYASILLSCLISFLFVRVELNQLDNPITQVPRGLCNYSRLARKVRWPSGKISALGPESSRFENRFHVGGQMSSRWCGAKIPTLATKKGVRPVEDQRGESPPTSMWRMGFIGYNKMIQALPEQGQ
ncbi:hypothetical protein AVEN_262158-1 [Araneus ventricosus]|uniref:Uncharacterized protein n=1 Tax=Araneus ventricosus TaxID=182803 RepID=A0A4Y2EJU2_ARAVE|nr:hypothetical protein AVEN_262158-1 [Araneus ventricosus]